MNVFDMASDVASGDDLALVVHAVAQREDLDDHTRARVLRRLRQGPATDYLDALAFLARKDDIEVPVQRAIQRLQARGERPTCPIPVEQY